MYRIRIVDASVDDVADTLVDLHRLTFFDAAPTPQFDLGARRLAYHGDDAVAFAGVVPSTYVRNGGYFSRVGVMQRHWGQGLQLRLMRAVEARGRRIGCGMARGSSYLGGTQDYEGSTYALGRGGVTELKEDVRQSCGGESLSHSRAGEYP
jgi:GNAT superfamily N-acetyltransferase